METPEWVKNAKVGDKVVCVDNRNNEPLVIGHIYKIKEISVGLTTNEGVVSVGFKLDEVTPTSNGNTQFHWACFKPLKSTEKGMSILREILNNPHKEIEKSLEDA